MAITLNSTTLITNPGPFAKFGASPKRLKCLKILGLATSNQLHCGGATYNTALSGWRALAAASNTALLGATQLQCQLAVIQLMLENGGLLTAATPGTNAQLATILSQADQILQHGDDQLDRMLTYLEGVQASTISGL